MLIYYNITLARKNPVILDKHLRMWDVFEQKCWYIRITKNAENINSGVFAKSLTYIFIFYLLFRPGNIINICNVFFKNLSLFSAVKIPIKPSRTAAFSFGFLSCVYCSSLVTNMLDIENLKIKTRSQDSLWHNR